MPSAFIDDGWTRDGYIAANEFHDEIRFAYRPATMRDAAMIINKVDREKAIRPDGVEVIADQWSVTRLVSWELVDRGGHPVAISADNLGKLHPLASGRLYKILLGHSVSDPDPREVASDSVGEQVALKN